MTLHFRPHVIRNRSRDKLYHCLRYTAAIGAVHSAGAWNYGLLILVSYFIWDLIESLWRSWLTKQIIWYSNIAPKYCSHNIYCGNSATLLEWKIFILPFHQKTERISHPEHFLKSVWLVRSIRDVHRCLTLCSQAVMCTPMYLLYWFQILNNWTYAQIRKNQELILEVVSIFSSVIFLPRATNMCIFK